MAGSGGGSGDGAPTDSSSREAQRQQIAFCRGEDGVRVAWARVGSGPPLIKTANWLNHLEYDWVSPVWSHFLRGLARAAELIRYDARGTGLSSRAVDEISFEAFVRDLEVVADASGHDRFALLGVSQGCAVSVAYAVRHPERVSTLLLYGGYARGSNLRGDAARERSAAIRTLMAQGWGEDNPRFRQIFTTAFVPDATREQMEWFNELQRRTATADVAVRIRETCDAIDVRELLPQVRVPTLVLHARDDAVVPFAEGELLAGGIPGARFVPLDGRNHLILRGEPACEHFFEEVRRFLATGGTPPEGAPDDTPAAGGAPAQLEPGDRVGTYEVLGLIARGGMGEVYRARHPGLEREVAVKTFAPRGPEGAQALRRFQREARLLASITHPNIAAVHDLILEHGRAYIVMELVVGETLRARLERGSLDLVEALDVARQLAAALVEAHAQGIVHRDLKPSNVILEESGRLKVLDFGLAKSRESAAAPARGTGSTTLTGTVLGTPGYMSPEQARGEIVDERADVWAWGCLVYEMLSGRRAFDGESANEVMAAVLRDEPDWDALPADTPRELGDLLRRCLVKDVAGRLSEASACLAASTGPGRSRRRWLRWPLALVPLFLAG